MAFVREITHPGRGFDRQVAKLWENRGASDSYDPEKWEDAHVDERVHGAAAASVPRELEDLCVRRHVRICPELRVVDQRREDGSSGLSEAEMPIRKFT